MTEEKQIIEKIIRKTIGMNIKYPRNKKKRLKKGLRKLITAMMNNGNLEAMEEMSIFSLYKEPFIIKGFS